MATARKRLVLGAWSRGLLVPATLGCALACGGQPVPKPTLTPGSADATETATATGTGTGTAKREAPPPAPDELLTGCGLDPASPAAVSLTGDFNSLPVAGSGTHLVLGFSVPFQMTTTTELTLSGSLESFAQTLKPTATASATGAQASADAAAAAGAGQITAALMPLAERAALRASAAAWKGVHCTVQPAVALTARLGSGNVVVTFTPALPTALTPRADADVYKQELAAPLTFSGIEGTVTASTVAGLGVGTKLAAAVTVEEIPATYTVKTSNGQSLPIGGDLGFAVHVDLGSPAASAALGLGSTTRYFIDVKSQTFKAIVVESADPSVPPVVYITK